MTIVLPGPGRVIDRWAKPMTVERQTSNGWQPDGTFDRNVGMTTLTIAAYLQPPSRSVMERGVEGQRIEQPDAVLWTRAVLQAVDEGAGTRGDIVIAPDGARYLVVGIARREEGGFTRAELRRLNERGRSL